MEELLNKAIEERISEDIDRMIEEKVEEFRRELTYNKNKYMADIMKNIFKGLIGLLWAGMIGLMGYVFGRRKTVRECNDILKENNVNYEFEWEKTK